MVLFSSVSQANHKMCFATISTFQWLDLLLRYSMFIPATEFSLLCLTMVSQPLVIIQSSVSCHAFIVIISLASTIQFHVTTSC